VVYLLEDATWEPTTKVREQFPSFYLEDKAMVTGSGIGSIQQATIGRHFHVYTRRPKTHKPNNA